MRTKPRNSYNYLKLLQKIIVLTVSLVVWQPGFSTPAPTQMATKVDIDRNEPSLTINVSVYAWGEGWEKFKSDGGTKDKLKQGLEGILNKNNYSKYKCDMVYVNFTIEECGNASTCPSQQGGVTVTNNGTVLSTDASHHGLYFMDAATEGDNKTGYDNYGVYYCNGYTTYGQYDPLKAKECYDLKPAEDKNIAGAYAYWSDIGSDGTAPGSIVVGAYQGQGKWDATMQILAHEFGHVLGQETHTDSSGDLMYKFAAGGKYVSINVWQEIFKEMKEECRWVFLSIWKIATSALDTYPGNIEGGAMCLTLESAELKLKTADNHAGCLSYDYGDAYQDPGNSGMTLPSPSHIVNLTDGCTIEGVDTAGYFVVEIGSNPDENKIMNDGMEPNDIDLIFLPKESIAPSESYSEKKCSGKIEPLPTPVTLNHFDLAVKSSGFYSMPVAFMTPKLNESVIGSIYTAEILKGTDVATGSESSKTFDFTNEVNNGFVLIDLQPFSTIQQTPTGPGGGRS